MVVKPMKTLKLHYPMIQFLVNEIIHPLLLIHTDFLPFKHTFWGEGLYENLKEGLHRRLPEPWWQSQDYKLSINELFVGFTLGTKSVLA